MQIHHTPPSLDDIADRIAADARAAVTAADRHRGDRHGDGLDAAAVLLSVIDRLTAAVVTVLQTTEHHAVIADHGVTRDTWLRAVAGRTGGRGDAAGRRGPPRGHARGDRVVPPADPVVGAVRQIIAATRNLTATQHGWVDDTLADGGVVRLDQDQIVAAVDGLANRARPDLARDRDAAAVRRRWLTLQPLMVVWG